MQPICQLLSILDLTLRQTLSHPSLSLDPLQMGRQWEKIDRGT